MHLKKYPLLIGICLLLGACGTGYQKENGGWVWVTNDENFGERSLLIEAADSPSFEVLSDKDFAKDNFHVYFRGKVIKDANPKTFELLDEKGYSKDSRHVFLEKEKIIMARPASFEVLQYPYAKDDQHLYCGTVPVLIPRDEIRDFQVTNEDKLMADMRSTITLAHFIEFNPAYAWLDTLGIENVVVGEWATGKTRTRKFIGFTEIKK